MEAAGIEEDENVTSASVRAPLPARIPEGETITARPTDRVLRLRRDRCVLENCDDAVDYLASRHLWPLPPGCTLHAHSTVEYFSDGERIGRYPALIADVRDVAGELVTCHVTWLHQGKKLEGHEPRKLLGPMTGRTGCAVRLMPSAPVMGIAEGIESALSAALLDGIPVWAALNTALLARFEPPPGVTTLRVYGDRDEAGLSAALRLFERLQGRVRIEIRLPRSPHKDFNDQLTALTGETHG
jgi:putative DNA primase/helicase